VKKVWEGRSHTFPPHFTPGYNTCYGPLKTNQTGEVEHLLIAPNYTIMISVHEKVLHKKTISKEIGLKERSAGAT